MSYEKELFHLMTNSQQMNDIVMACTYGLALLKLLDTPHKLQRPIELNRDQLMVKYQKLFEDILMLVVTRVKMTIDEVRQYYITQKGYEVPTYTKPKEAVTQ